MEEKQIYENIASLNRELKNLFNADIIFSGSYGLYLNGIKLKREFHDIDIKVIGIDPRLVRKEGKCITSMTPIHFLGFTNVPLEYHEIEINGEKILTYTVETILRCKKETIRYNERRKIKTEFTERKSEKDKKDLEYIKEKYGIEV